MRVRTAALAAAVLAVPVALFGVSGSAQATNNPFTPETSFNIDGNPTGPDDFGAPYGPGTTTGGLQTPWPAYNERNMDLSGLAGC